MAGHPHTARRHSHRACVLPKELDYRCGRLNACAQQLVAEADDVSLKALQNFEGHTTDLGAKIRDGRLSGAEAEAALRQALVRSADMHARLLNLESCLLARLDDSLKVRKRVLSRR